MVKVRSMRGKRIPSQESASTVRLDPETRFLAELAAKIESRTFNSFIEWAAKVALQQVKVPGTADMVSDLAGKVWSPDERIRFLNLMFKYPRLLDETGHRLLLLLRENGYLWRGDYKENRGYVYSTNNREDLYEDRLRENWEKFKAVAEGKADPSILPKLDKPKKMGK